MMECYQKCIDIGKRCCTSLGSTGTCTDCGQICRRSLFKPESPECRCNTKPVCCQSKRTGCESAQHAQPDTQGTPASGKKQKKKQSFWQWLLSLIGFGAKEEESEEEGATAEKHVTGRPHSVKTNKPTEIFSPEKILAEVKEICGEIKNLKPDLPIKEEQFSPPPAQRGDEPGESKTQTTPSPERKKKKKGKGKSPPRSPGREKYLGKPLESSPPQRTRSRSKSRSPTTKEKSPARKDSSTSTEKQIDSGEYQRQSREKPRPPTSPIWSSERYLKPYVSASCPRDLDCQECCKCSPTTSSFRLKDSDRKRAKHCGKKTKECSRDLKTTMPCACCSCSICCGRTCPSPCPKSCCDPICYTPCCRPLFSSCSFCCCRPELKNSMKKQRGSTHGSCSPRGRDKGTKSKRRRCSSCPSSPCSPSRSYGVPICPPCPPCLPRPCSPTYKLLPKGPHCPCPLSSDCSRAKFACRSPCPALPPFRPCCSGCPCPPLRSVSPSYCPRPCRPSPCGTCPITCMKPCCMPCVPNGPPSCPQRCSAPSPGTKFSFPRTGTMSSYGKSKDNDSLCKQLMARYNITAPEPRAFCPLPRNLCTPRNICVPCEMPRLHGAKTYSSRAAGGCPPCSRGCYNNNKPLSFSKSMDYDNFTCSLNAPTPFQSRIKEPITFNKYPSHSRPRLEFRIPKRTPVECIRQRGPRSPCKEYMTTYRFLKETRKEITSTNRISENVPPSLTDEKTLESPEKVGKKSKTKKHTDSKRKTSQSAGEVTEGEAGNNQSENKAILKESQISDGPSSVRSWKMSGTKPKRNARSKSSDTVKKTYKENASPIKTGRPSEWSSYDRRYSYSSKSFFPSFLSLSPTYQLSRQTAVLPMSPIFGQQHRFSPKASIGEFSGNTKLSHGMDFQPRRYQRTNSTSSCQPALKLDNYDYDLSRTFDPNVRYPRAKWNIPSTNAQASKSAKSPAFHQKKSEDVSTRGMNVEADDSSALEDTSIKETDSSALLPKVESISSLVEKYDRVEVSAIGVMAQSKCNIFDYISADSSSPNTSSPREDPSLSTVEEFTTEENTVHETTSIVPKQERSQSEAFGDIFDDNANEGVEMNKNNGTSKIDRAQGDIDRPCEKTEFIPQTKTESRTSDFSGDDVLVSSGDNLIVPITDLKFETVTERIDLSNCYCVYMRGESSVDPAEYGTIGESAVDPSGGKYKCEMEGNPFATFVNQSNCSNSVEPGDVGESQIDPVEPTGFGEGEHGASEAESIPNKVIEGMLKEDETNSVPQPMSALDELISSSGVRWAKVTPSTEADIKLLRLSKAAHSIMAKVDPSTGLNGGQQGAPTPSNSSTNRPPDPEPQSVLDLLKSEKVDYSSGLLASTDEFSCDSPAGQISEFGTPV